MPPAGTVQRLKQLAQGFLGVNLRKDRVTLADQEVARAINADLHEHPGSLILRRGRRKVFSTPLADLAIRRLAFVNGVRYVIAGQSAYRDQVKVIDGLLSGELFTTMASFRPLSDSATWVFIADTGGMNKDDGSRLVPWGIETPAVPVAHIGAMGTGLTGAYISGYTSLRHEGDAIASESAAAQAEDTITLANGRLALSDIQDSADEQVTGVGIYRSVAGGALLLLDSREVFPTTSTTISVTHGWEVASTPGGTEPDGLQHHWTIDKGTRRGSQSWEPEADAGLRFIGATAMNGTSLTLPDHEAGDLLVMFAYATLSPSPPSVPGSWSTWSTGGGVNNARSVGGYKVATTDSETSGDWAGASHLVCHVYRGQRVAGAIGGTAAGGASSGTTVTYPALTMTDAGGTSLVVGFAGRYYSNSILERPPVGMTNRVNFMLPVPTGEVSGHDTDDAVAAWTAGAVAVGGTSGPWRALTLEIRAETAANDTVGTSEDANGYRATHLWEVADATLITTQTKLWAYASVIADSALGAEAPDANANPPLASWVTEFQGHLFLTRLLDNSNHLRWSTRFTPESWPEDNLLEIGAPDDPLQCAVPIAGLLGVFSLNTKYRVTGNATAGFVSQEALSRRGTNSPLAVISSEYGVIFPHHDGIFRTNLLSVDEELSAEISPLFYGETVNDMAPINWAAANTFSAVYRKGRYYFAYASGESLMPDKLAVLSRTTSKWYFFDHPARSLSSEESQADDLLVAGFTDGLVYIIEEGDSDAGDDIALSAETKDYFGPEPDVRKLYLYAVVDAEVPSGATLSVDLYVDGTLKRTASVTGSRTRLRLPFPEGSMGYTWRTRFRYTGSARVRIYGASAIMLPLEAS